MLLLVIHILAHYRCVMSVLQRRFIYRSSEAIYGECSYIEEKAVYINIIHGKSVQWVTR